MTRYDRLSRLLAASLSCVAGYVDALGFLKLRGFFVSFMSGNSTRLGVGLAQVSANATPAAGLIICFVTGVIVGALVRKASRVRPRVTVLTLVAFLLTVAAALNSFGQMHATLGLIALAMGAENAVFERGGEVSIALTYMTGTLVKLGQNIAIALTGGPPLGWTPYLMLWVGLVSGAAAGAGIYPWLGLGGLWLAAGTMAALVALGVVLDLDEPQVDR